MHVALVIHKFELHRHAEVGLQKAARVTRHAAGPPPAATRQPNRKPPLEELSQISEPFFHFTSALLTPAASHTLRQSTHSPARSSRVTGRVTDFCRHGFRRRPP